MIVNKRVRERLPLTLLNQPNAPAELLKFLYVTKNLSASKIGNLFGVQTDTVRRWLIRLEIPRKPRVEIVIKALTKHPKVSFSGNEKEKAYLLGLRAADISIQRHGRAYRASVSTPHPAMLRLFAACFGKYAKTRYYPKKAAAKGGRPWAAYADLDSSFGFLEKKPERIPEDIRKQPELFWQYLAGYFDGDGCLSASVTKRGETQVKWTVNSCNKQMLYEISQMLKAEGVHLRLSLAHAADGKKYKQDYWVIVTSDREQILRLLARLPIQHPEKLQKRELVSRLCREGWKNAKMRIQALRNNIRNGVARCSELSAAAEIDRKAANRQLLRLIENTSSDLK